ncbi:MAG: SDR family oxidoreductase [Balneolaceae bacterium]
MSYKDQVVWITGASSGIGEALVYAFHEQGAHLILSSRRAGELNRVRDNCRGDTSGIHILPLDLTDTDSHSTIADKAVGLYGRIDLLLNNGGISQRGLAHETQTDVIRQIMEVNFFGTVNLTKQVLPYMIEKKSGHIVVMSSVIGKFGTRLRSAYAASKHALHGWFDCLRQETAVHNIDVTIVCPGFVKTNVTYNALLADGTLLSKLGTGQMQGMTPEKFTRKLMPRLARKKREIYIGGREVAAVYFKRFFPNLLDTILKRVRVT